MSADERLAARRFCSSDFVGVGGRDQHDHQRQQLQPFRTEFERTACSFDESLHIWLDWVIQRCEEGNLHQQHELHSEAYQ